MASGKLSKNLTTPVYRLCGSVNVHVEELKMFAVNTLEPDSLNNADLVREDIVKSTLNGGII